MGKKKKNPKKSSELNQLEINKTEINIVNTYINIFHFVPEKGRKLVAAISGLIILITFFVTLLGGLSLLGVETEYFKPEQFPEAKVTITGWSGFEFSNPKSYGLYHLQLFSLNLKI